MSRRYAAIASLAVLMASIASTPSNALIVKRWDGVGSSDRINTTPPADDPGWANLADSRQGIYLGDGLFLTARHTNDVRPITIAGGTFEAIPGSGRLLTNPSSFASNSVAAGTLTAESDLLIYRIGLDTATGLSPEELDPAIRRISIASSLPSTSQKLTIFGLGANRILNTANTNNGQWYYDSAGAVITNSVDWPTASYRGFKYTSQPNSNNWAWQWGENQRTTSTGGAPSSGSNILIELGGQRKDTIGFQTRFDEFGLTNESQGAPGDSGGPVFWKNGDEWVLAGLMHGVYANLGSNNLIGTFGSYTAISDLSYAHYRSQLEAARGVFSVMGDIDLDGSITGSIVNGVATGDLGILVQNWMHNSGSANIHSWMAGDLNQDGLTNLADFVLMRDALGGSISASSFASLVSAMGIPEPTAGFLAASGILLAAGRRRR